jgi:hypothetical protein
VVSRARLDVVKKINSVVLAWNKFLARPLVICALYRLSYPGLCLLHKCMHLMKRTQCESDDGNITGNSDEWGTR